MLLDLLVRPDGQWVSPSSFLFLFSCKKVNLKLVKYVTSLMTIRTINLLWLDINDERGFGSFATDLRLSFKILCLIFLL